MNGGILFLSLLAVPLLAVVIDAAGGLAPKRRAVRNIVAPVDDFEVLVPIWGSVDYLVNVDYLAAYGTRVVLCTTSNESVEFYQALEAIAAKNGFRIFRGDSGTARGRIARGARQTSGLVRDRLVRDVHAVLSAKYVVCIDADTRTTQPLDVLVGQVAASGFDFASVRVVPANTTNWLGRLQAHEYRLAMKLRMLSPWLVSGACHVGLRTAHRDVMERHSLFFQGNDVEAGWLADALELRVGHVPFEVPTIVPETVRGWWRQRYAWAGGEVRLFLVNPQLALRHPLLWLYGAVITLGGIPFRWASLLHPGGTVLSILALYLAALAFLHRGHLDRWLLLLPFYTLFSSLVLVPLGLASYLTMAIRHKNFGLIRMGGRGRHARRTNALTPDLRAVA